MLKITSVMVYPIGDESTNLDAARRKYRVPIISNYRNGASPPFLRIVAACAITFTSLFCASNRHAKSEDAVGNVYFEPKVLERIPPGTAVFDKTKRGMSDLLLFVKGKLEAGDVDSVTSSVKYYGDLFNLVYMANTRKGPDGFDLEAIKVGFSSKINGQDVVVSSDTASALGLNLNLIGRSVLSGNERALDDIKIIARNRRSAVVDAPAVVRFKESNQLMIVRFFIWVSESDGRVGTIVWLLSTGADGYAFAEDKFNFLSPEMIEERVLFVDGSKFTFGIPSATAFAMTTIPQGRSFPITERFKRFGANEVFTPQSFKGLLSSISDAIGKTQPASK